MLVENDAAFLQCKTGKGILITHQAAVMYKECKTKSAFVQVVICERLTFALPQSEKTFHFNVSSYFTIRKVLDICRKLK